MANDDQKRYYWLRLKKDFFQQHQIKVLKALPNGRLYALIYLELLAESTTHDGELRYSKTLPYDTVTLASVIDEDKDNLEKAIETFINLELVEVLEDKTIYMRELSKLVGSETGAATRKRKYRESLKGDNVPLLSQECLQESREKRIEDRVKSLYIIIKDRYAEAGMDKDELDQIEMMMIKAAQITNICPSSDRIQDFTNDLLEDGGRDLYNRQGYLIRCFEREESICG